MPSFITPNSWGTSLRETTKDASGRCHQPAGTPAGGQFTGCGPGGAAGKGPIRQEFGRRVAIPASLGGQIKAIQDDKSLSESDKKIRIATLIDREAPDLLEAAKELEARGKQEQGQFRTMMQGLAEELGFKFHENIESRDLYADESNWVVLGPVKSALRTATKTALDYEGDTSRVKDVIRATVAVRSASDMATALARLFSHGEVSVVPGSVKDNVNRPANTGYRDINLLLRTRTGMLAEIQILTKPMLEAKMTVGHRLYEPWRELAEGTARWWDLLKQQQQVYGTAWAKSAASVVALGNIATMVSRVRG